MKTLVNITIIILLNLIVASNAMAQSTFSRQTLEQAITNYVKKENKCESKVEILQAVKSQKFSQNGIKAGISHTDNLIGDCSVQLTFYDGENVILKENVRIKVRVYADVPVALHFIGKEIELTAEDIAIKKAEVTDIDPNAVVELSEAIGKFSKSGIAKGAVIKYSDLTLTDATSSETLIKKNDKVNLIYYAGVIAIRMDGVALDNGAIGSVIKVRRTDNAQTLYGFIADDGNVIIEDKSKLTAK